MENNRNIPFDIMHDEVRQEGKRQRDNILDVYRSGEPLHEDQIFDYLIAGIQNDTVNARMRANVSSAYRQTGFNDRLDRNLRLIEECKQHMVTPELVEVIKDQLSSVNYDLRLMSNSQGRTPEKDIAESQDEKAVLELIIERFDRPTVDTEPNNSLPAAPIPPHENSQQN